MLSCLEVNKDVFECYEATGFKSEEKQLLVFEYFPFSLGNQFLILNPPVWNT